MEWEVGGRFKREGIYVYLWLIHVDVWQKPTQFRKAIILCSPQQSVENSSRDGNTRPPVLPVEKSVCRIKEQQLELDMEQQTGSK